MGLTIQFIRIVSSLFNFQIDLEAKDSYLQQVVALKEDGPSLPKRKRK